MFLALHEHLSLFPQLESEAFPPRVLWATPWGQPPAVLSTWLTEPPPTTTTTKLMDGGGLGSQGQNPWLPRALEEWGEGRCPSILAPALICPLSAGHLVPNAGVSCHPYPRQDSTSEGRTPVMPTGGLQGACGSVFVGTSHSQNAAGSGRHGAILQSPRLCRFPHPLPGPSNKPIFTHPGESKSHTVHTRITGAGRDTSRGDRCSDIAGVGRPPGTP